MRVEGPRHDGLRLLGRVGSSHGSERAEPEGKLNRTIFKTFVSVISAKQIWPVCLAIVKSPCKKFAYVPCV